MDEIKPQKTSSPIGKKKDIEARLYALEKKLAEVFNQMARIISALYLENNVKIPEEKLEPYYQELDQINNEIQKIARIRSQPQVLIPHEPDIIFLLEESRASNQTFTNTNPFKTSSWKIKVRYPNTKKPTNHSQTSTIKNNSIIASAELLKKIEEKRLTASQSSDNINGSSEKKSSVQVKLKPQRRF